MTNENLTKAELSVMELLWQSKHMTARQIREQLCGNSEKAQHGTLQRSLQSLNTKGFVHRARSLGIQLFSTKLGHEA